MRHTTHFCRQFRLIYLFIYYTVYTHVKSFTIVKNRKCGQVTSHCRKARPYRADLSLFLNVPVVAVKSEITVWGRLFQTVGEAWQKARLEKLRTDALPRRAERECVYTSPQTSAKYSERLYEHDGHFAWITNLTHSLKITILLIFGEWKTTASRSAGLASSYQRELRR